MTQTHVAHGSQEFRVQIVPDDGDESLSPFELTCSRGPRAGRSFRLQRSELFDGLLHEPGETPELFFSVEKGQLTPILV